MPPIAPQMVEGNERKSIAEILKSSSSNLSNFKRHMTTWIAVSRHAFCVIEEPEFRKMISDLNSNAVELLPKSPNTIRSWVLKQFESQKQIIKERFQQSRSRIHLSLDLWTTPSRSRTYLGIVGHWVDHDNEIREVLIALPELKGSHTGVNIGDTVIKVIEEYGIGAKLGYYMLDNASNNDTTIKEIYKRLSEKYESAIFLSPDEARLRCFGHVLNLAAKALLFGIDPDAFEHGSGNELDPKAEEAEFLKWRRSGSIGRAYNFVVFLYRSSQRQQLFRMIQVEILKWDHSILPHQGNSTRWNSHFLMMNDLLNLREVVEIYISMCKTSKTMDAKDKKKLEEYCLLRDEDWEELTQLHAILYDFWDLTLRMEGNVARKLQVESKICGGIDERVYNKPNRNLVGRRKFSEAATSKKSEKSEDGALFNVLPAYEHLLSKLEAAKSKHANDTHFGTLINLAWSKLNGYYKATDVSNVYLVAAVMDPRLNLHYFEKNWKSVWLIGARNKLEAHAEHFAQAMKIDPNYERIVEHPNDEADDGQESTFGSWRQVDEDITEAGLKREWEEYLNMPRVRDYTGFSVRGWWLMYEGKFPILSKVALELLAVPAMSTEIERVFSG